MMFSNLNRCPKRSPLTAKPMCKPCPRLFEVCNSRLDGKMDLTEKDDFHACRILSASQNRVIMAQGPPRPASLNGPWTDWNGGYWTL